jgi:peptidase E
MRILIVGSKNWINYNEFIRNVTIAIEDAANDFPDDKRIVFVHTGTQGAENMTSEYVGKVEKFMRQKGYSVKEELFRKKYSGNNVDKITSDYDMITSGVDSALVFIRASDRRAEYCTRILKEFDIPTKIIKE